MAQGRGRPLPPLPKLSKSEGPGKKPLPSLPPPAGAKVSKKASPTLAQLDLGPAHAPVPVSTEHRPQRRVSGSHPVVGTDEEFLDIVTSSHPALKLDPKILEEADDDFEEIEAIEDIDPTEEEAELDQKSDLDEDFFAVTDDDEEGTTAVTPPVQAPAPADAANEGPRAIASNEPEPAARQAASASAQAEAPPPAAATSPAARDTTTDSVPDLSASAHRAQVDLEALDETFEPAPRRRPAAAFAVGVGVGIAAGVAVAVLLVSPLGLGADGGDGDGTDIAAASVAGAVPTAPACPDPETDLPGHDGSADDAESTPAAIAAPPTEAPPADTPQAGVEGTEAPEVDVEVSAAADDNADDTAGVADAPSLAVGDPAAATAAMTAIAEVEDDLPELAQARAALVRGQPQKAIELALAVHDQAPNNAAIEIMTVAHCRLGDGPAARKLFRQLVFKDPRRRVADRCLELEIQIFADTLERTPKEMLAAASRHYNDGQREEAERLALESFKERRRPEALALVGMIACDAHDADKAERYARRIDGETHDKLVAHCAEQGISLPAK